jgi:Ser/Thr protein kinase RdoA (MazF antagonist)
MGAAATGAKRDLHEPELRRAVEELLSAARGQATRVASVSRRPSPFATLSPVEILAAELDGGESLLLFLKRGGGEQAGHPDKQCANREMRVYAELLRDEGLPVVRFNGALRDCGGGQQALLMEYLDAWSLKYCDLAQWEAGVRRLAELHAHFAAQPARLWRCDALLRFDADYFRGWAERALTAAAECDADLARQLEPLVRNNGLAANLIASTRATLVHNDLSPKNVLIDRSCDPPRVAVIDWEQAGVGCGLLDLAHLTYGLDERDLRRMCDAYRAAWPDRPRLPEGEAQFDAVLASCQFQKALYRLARWKAWRVPPARVRQWVGEAERHSARVQKGVA